MGARLGVTRLTLTNFRSYAALRLDVDTRPVVLTGANGAGKTNLLEALSFLAPGRGLRGARLGLVGRRQAAHLNQTGPDTSVVPWAVAVTLSTPDGPIEMGTGIAVAGTERRTVHINGQAAKGAAAMARHVGAVWLTPAMDRLFADGPGSRRKFLDRLVTAFDADHAGRLAAYEHAYRQRLRLMKDGSGDAPWFAALEDTMARHGVALAAGRHDLVARLNRDLAGVTGPFPAASLGLVGTIDSWLAQMPAVDVEDAMRRSLWDERRGVMGAGAGPHRSDLGVAMIAPGHASHGQPAALCSTGEQKALLISMLLAHARLQRGKRGHAPLLLLDEIAAHLDQNRRAALFAEILRLGAQAWMTGTEPALFRGFDEKAQFFTVESGAILAASPP
ncbi:MAG: DNA replication/repair protein RecF [Rhodospirillaceae bacterium]|nr:DNA replication/repair protein RecF [Rhodospirillaceae bacterium]